MSPTDQPGPTGVSVVVDQNPYLAEGAGTVDAIVTVAVAAEGAGSDRAPERVEAIIIDCSASMRTPSGKFDEAKRATVAAIDELVDGTYFAIVAGTTGAVAVYPADGEAIPADAATRSAAAAAVDALRPSGGTAMGTWLAHVRQLAARHPAALVHAILLTDGKDEHETPEQLGAQIGLCEGEFTCDCRGVGTDWQVEELRAISSALFGTVDIVADPADLADDFAAMMRVSMSKTIPELSLRLWTPAGARVAVVKQVAPTIEDLSHRGFEAASQCVEYALGAWGAEERDYHLQVVVLPAAAGREKLAARATVTAGGEILAEGLVKAIWTTDTTLSAPISRRVAHYTGQVGLARAVQDGLAALKSGDVPTATARLRQARELAVESGNGATAGLLDKVIDVDEHTGTARLRREIAAADEMALDARSTRTARVRTEGS